MDHMTISREYFRFRWSHDHIIHRRLVRTFNTIMRVTPFGMKYGAGLILRRNSPPYNLVQPGATVVQIGAPRVMLWAGPSRDIYFSLLAKETGKVLIVEPDQESIRELRLMIPKQGLINIILAPYAAWSAKKILKIRINPRHPAANFIEGTKIPKDEHLAEFHQASIPADALDNILDANNVKCLDLVSITTNGAEFEIIKGMVKAISRGVSYISLARTGNYAELMKSIGYEAYTYDDRGITFRQSKILCLDELRKVLWPPII